MWNACGRVGIYFISLDAQHQISQCPKGIISHLPQGKYFIVIVSNTATPSGVAVFFMSGVTRLETEYRGPGWKRRLRKQSSFSMKFVPCGTSEILLRNKKYAPRMKYACGIWRNEFYFTFCPWAKYFIIRQDYFILRKFILRKQYFILTALHNTATPSGVAVFQTVDFVSFSRESSMRAVFFSNKKASVFIDAFFALSGGILRFSSWQKGKNVIY